MMVKRIFETTNDDDVLTNTLSATDFSDAAERITGLYFSEDSTTTVPDDIEEKTKAAFNVSFTKIDESGNLFYDENGEVSEEVAYWSSRTAIGNVPYNDDASGELYYKEGEDVPFARYDKLLVMYTLTPSFGKQTDLPLESGLNALADPGSSAEYDNGVNLETNFTSASIGLNFILEWEIKNEPEPEPEPEQEPEQTEAEIVSPSDEITPGSEVQIETEIVNQQDDQQPFAYIVQIKDEIGATISISMITGVVGQGQTITQTISWTPSESGIYVAEVYLWSDLNQPIVLSNVETQYITVN
jgi:hypothetical protein